MCGIAGIIAMDEQVALKALDAMNTCQIHRGPDDSGQSIRRQGDRILGLAHRRLAILDLSPAGHQPMVHPETGDEIIFNGEIYNYQLLRDELLAAGESFKGHSDTEVLLHGLTRWGVDFIKRLDGMFAFAFYDSRGGRLILARDSIGIKPMYTASVGRNFLFASEVRAILSTNLVSRRIDVQGMAGLMAYGCPQQPRTILADIRAFPPGSYQVIDLCKPSVTSSPVVYWEYPLARHGQGVTELVPAIESTLETAVKNHLVADVPVGMFLSSGLDSTVIAGLAAKHADQLRSFTVGFADQPDMSELVLAKETAKLFRLNHTEIHINNNDAEEAAMAWFGSMDQPSFDGLNIYVISKAVRAQGITVALSGQGGDELFGGYSSFHYVPRIQRGMRRIGFLPGPVRSLLARGASMGRSQAVRQKLHDMILTDGSVRELYFQRRRAMSDAQLHSLGLDAQRLGLLSNYLVPEALQGVHIDEDDPIWSISQLESRFYQGNMLLRDGDANGMAHSLEIRVPLLDQKMLDLMLPIPGAVRLPPGRGYKHLMRVAFAPYLRPAVLKQTKRGFSLPMRRWMIGPLRDLCEQGLINLKHLGVVEPKGIDAVWNTFLAAPESPMWSRAFTLSVLGMYTKRLNISA